MKKMLVGGGVVDFATLHPLGTLMIVILAVWALQRAARMIRSGGR